jgi:hydroxyacyl-ACP dehydratase HTD2-like protein with hotdog domain
MKFVGVVGIAAYVRRLWAGGELEFLQPERQPINKLKVEIMNKKLNSIPSAGTKDDSSTTADVSMSSPTCPKPIVELNLR